MRSPSRSASSKRLNTIMPTPSPTIMPSEFSSKGRGLSLLVKAGVLLKHIYINGELSVSTPPVIIISLRPSTRSLMASFIAPMLLAQAASTTQFIPPRSRRLAMRPAMTFPNMPGKLFSSQRTYALRIFSMMRSASSPAMPLLSNARRHTGYCKRLVSGVMSFCPPPTPSTTPVRSRMSAADSA